jgi:N-acetylglucosaminyl-diphospho-decaprenol L-rhamnosyltransferase
MDVSVIVLAWEDHVRTTACVRSLPPDAEILVVDNGSAAEHSEKLRRLCDETGAAYIRSDTNLGYAKGMNLGLRHSTRTHVILSNNDVVVHPGAIEKLLDVLADQGVGAAFPAVRDAAGHEQTAAGRFLSLPVGLGHATGLDMILPSLRITATPQNGDWFSGPFVAMRRDTLLRIGGVDESSFFYSEDLRLCWAVRKQLRLRLAYSPDAVITHEDDASARRRWSDEEIAARQTREFVRASRELGGVASRWAAWLYVFGIRWRAVVSANPRRKAVATAAIEGLRAR